MNTETLWARVDEPLLRWVLSLPPSLVADLVDLKEREPEPFPHVKGLDTREANDGLYRLHLSGLIEGNDSPSMASTTWSRLRVTARGLIVLGEWPDLERVVSAASLTTLLRRLAEEAPEEHRSALERTAGVLSRTADEALKGTAADIARTLGKEAASG